MILYSAILHICVAWMTFTVAESKMVPIATHDTNLHDDYGYNSPTCSQTCSDAGSSCIEPFESASGGCKRKAQLYCNTKAEFVRATIDDSELMCTTDWCFADCRHHKYYDASREMTCDEERHGACRYPSLDAICECEDIEFDYSPRQYMSHRVRQGIKLFIIMTGAFFCCFVVVPRITRSKSDSTDSTGGVNESERGLLSSSHDDADSENGGRGVELGQRRQRQSSSGHSGRTGSGSSRAVTERARTGERKKQLAVHRKTASSASVPQAGSRKNHPLPERSASASKHTLPDALKSTPVITHVQSHSYKSSGITASEERASILSASVQPDDKAVILKRRAEQLELARPKV